MTTEKSAGRMNLEGVLERVIFGGRWLLAPLYVGLSVSLVAIVWQFLRRSLGLAEIVSHGDTHEVTLKVLELLDLTLLANLILIVIFAGYENFVSKINVATKSEDRPHWMGKVDYSGLKIKLIGSLVAISVIELLKDFMQAESYDDFEPVAWRIGIHLTFVVSGVLFAVMDYLADKRSVMESMAEARLQQESANSSARAV